MKRVILDENLPHPLLNQLTTHEFSTVQHEGWTGVSNGELLDLLDQAGWNVFVTSDKNLRYQQNLSERHIAILELPTNRWPALQSMISKIQSAINDISLGDYQIL